MSVFLFISLALLCQAGTNEREAFKQLPIQDYIIYSFVCVFLVCMGGLMSGLTVGLLGIDEISLELKITSGTESEKKDALKVLHVIEKHHLLLVTLLLANAIAMEALPLFLDTMFNTEISVLISVTFVLIFGEVIPQSLCTGPNQIRIACKCIPIVKVIMVILFPLAYPIARLLDKALGEKEAKKKLDDKQLKTFIGIQKLEERSSIGLDIFQVKMMTNLMDLSKWKARDLMTDLSHFQMVEKLEVINQELIRNAMKSELNFIIVYSEKKTNICGTFPISRLFSAIREKNFNVSFIYLEEFHLINDDKTALECLKMLSTFKKNYLFVTCSSSNSVIGLVKKSDIMGKIMLSQKYDEKNGINEISNALISVLEHRDENRNISSKTEVIKRTSRVISH